MSYAHWRRLRGQRTRIDLQKIICFFFKRPAIQTSKIQSWEDIKGFDDVWTYNLQPKNFFPMRTVAIRTDDGGLIVYNPVRNLGQDIHSELAKIGDVRWVISPNHYHTLAADGWQQLYPKAKFFAHLQAHPRLKKQTKVSWLDIVDLIPILPKGVTLKKPRGLKTGEIGLCLERPDIKMWIFGDLFFNIPKLPPGLFGFILRLGGTAPGLHSSRVFRLIAVSDRQDFLQWLQENLAQDRPQCFVPTHGEILFHPALSQRLYDVASANLKRKKNIS